MKKFTNISNTTVGQEKIEKIDENREKINNFNNNILKLMDEFLSVRSYGSARPELIMPVKIVGKEMFIEALQDLLKNEENKKFIQLLESLKKDIHDWSAIDNKIDDLSSNRPNLKEKTKILEMIDKWGDDKESFAEYLNLTKNKLDSIKKQERLELLDTMIEESNNQNITEKLILFKSEILKN